MSFRLLQLSPQTSTSVAQKIAVLNRWAARSTTLTGDMSMDMGFLHSWFEPDTDVAATFPGRVNWGAVYGMAFSVGFSGICWAGVVWVIAHIWR